MGAIFGFLGDRESALVAPMRAALRRRGDQLCSERTAAGTLCHLSPHNSPPHSPSGLLREGDLIIALSGMLTGALQGRLLGDLLDDYRRRGPRMASDLEGAFVLAILDGSTLHLVRDGAGQRTLYYARQGRSWLFAIEPKGILASPGFSRRLRPAALAQYLTFSFIPGEGTMLEDLHELPAGHWLSCSVEGGSRLSRHFHFERSEPSDEAARTDTDDQTWADRFRRQFSAAIEDRLPPRGQPLGVFLSGGIDSSIVTAELARLRPGIKSYAIHFGPRYANELEFARLVAERCGTDHREVLIQPRNFLPRLRQMVWRLDEPIGDPITMPNYELAAIVRDETPQVFNGEGGDPCFGGPKNIPLLMQHWYGGLDRSDNFRERAYLASYRRGYEELHRLLTPDVLRGFDEREDLDGVVRPFFQSDSPRRFLNKMLAINIRLKGAHLILPKVERMLAAWGVTPHSPLFDERLIRLAFEMPGHMKLRDGIEKYVLKLAYRDELPEVIINRPKSGMRVPVHYWFKGELRRYARKILSPREVRRVGLFQPDRVKQLLDYNIEEGQGRYGLRLWMLLTFELWRRIVIEGESAS